MAPRKPNKDFTRADLKLISAKSKKTNRQLARHIGMNENTFNAWLLKGRMPYNAYIKLQRLVTPRTHSQEIQYVTVEALVSELGSRGWEVTLRRRAMP